MFRAVLTYVRGGGSTNGTPGNVVQESEVVEDEGGGLEALVAEMNESAKVSPADGHLKGNLPTKETTQPQPKRRFVENLPTTSQDHDATSSSLGASRLRRKQRPSQTPIARRDIWNVASNNNAGPVLRPHQNSDIDHEPQKKKVKGLGKGKTALGLNRSFPGLDAPVGDTIVCSPSTNKNVDFSESPSQISRRPRQFKASAIRATIKSREQEPALQTNSVEDGQNQAANPDESPLDEPTEQQQASPTPLTQENPAIEIQDSRPTQAKENTGKRSPNKRAGKSPKKTPKRSPKKKSNSNTDTDVQNTEASGAAYRTSRASRLHDDDENGDRSATPCSSSRERHSDTRNKERSTPRRKEIMNRNQDGGQSRLSEQEKTSACQDVEDPVMVCHCRDAWASMLAAADALSEGRTKSRAETTLASRISHILDKLSRKYDTLNKVEGAEADKVRQNIKTLTTELEQKMIGLVCDETSDDFYIQGRDLYEHLVPKIVHTLKQMLQSLFHNGSFDLSAFQQLHEILDIAVQMADKACNWETNDKKLDLTQYARNWLRNSIRSNSKIIRDKYEAQINQILRPIIDKDYVDSLAIRAQTDWSDLQESIQKRRQAILQRSRDQRSKLSWPPPNGVVVLDVDAIVVDEVPVPVDTAENGHATIERSTQTSLVRPQKRILLQPANEGIVPDGNLTPLPEIPSGKVVRDSSERTLGPSKHPWTNEELIALANGLQQFTSISRYQDIIKAFGGSEGPLRNRDWEGILEQARFLKRSMAPLLQNSADDSWQWLQSV